jgi:hypothetical protein
LQSTESITVNVAGPSAQNFEDFEYGVDYFDGRLEEDHSRPFINLFYDQYRWDGKNMYYYINANGELVVRINQKYNYDASFVGSISGTNLTVTAIDSGVIEIGMTVFGQEVISSTTITSQTSGEPGSVGVYVVSEDHDTPPLPDGNLIGIL